MLSTGSSRTSLTRQSSLHSSRPSLSGSPSAASSRRFPSPIGHCILLYPRPPLFFRPSFTVAPNLSLSLPSAMPLHFLPTRRLTRLSTPSPFPRFVQAFPATPGATTTTTTTNYTTSFSVLPRSCRFAPPFTLTPFSLDHSLRTRSLPVLPRAVLPVSRIASPCNALVCAI